MDLQTGAIVAVTLQEADQGDTTTIQTTLPEAVEQLEAVVAVTDDVVRTGEELVADKGYHSKQTVLDVIPGTAQLHQRTGSGSAALDRSARRARRSVCQSAAHRG